MNIEPTIPCPVCDAPVLVKLVELPTGELTRVYAEPLAYDNNMLSMHKHQIIDVDTRSLH